MKSFRAALIGCMASQWLLISNNVVNPNSISIAERGAVIARRCESYVIILTASDRELSEIFRNLLKLTIILLSKKITAYRI
jgi:hypothetical protein